MFGINARTARAPAYLFRCSFRLLDKALGMRIIHKMYILKPYVMKKQIQNPLTVISEITISYRPKFRPSQRPVITCADDAYRLLSENWDQDRMELCEQFAILLLNRTRNVIGMATLSTGGHSGTVVDAKMVFSVALKACASSIILCHNHPSGNLKPSNADIRVTANLKGAGLLLDILVDDHIIIGRYGYCSLLDDGMM